MNKSICAAESSLSRDACLTSFLENRIDSIERWRSFNGVILQAPPGYVAIESKSDIVCAAYELPHRSKLFHLELGPQFGRISLWTSGVVAGIPYRGYNADTNNLNYVIDTEPNVRALLERASNLVIR